MDEDYGEYGESIGFYLGRHTVHGQLATPPSNPALSVSDITVRAHYMGDESLVPESRTNAYARFELKNLVSGNWHFEIQTRYNEQTYFSFGSVMIAQDTNLSFNVLHTDDVLKGVLFFMKSHVEKTSPKLTPEEEAIHGEKATLHRQNKEQWDEKLKRKKKLFAQEMKKTGGIVLGKVHKGP